MAPITALAQEPEAAAVDYDRWATSAERAETAIADPATSDQRLEEFRGHMVYWRGIFLTAQTANSSRIATVREQIAALGAPPAEGATEEPQLAARRSELADQLITLQAPGIAADEAYRRADGLIREIDSTLRERQADQMLKLWPSPVNPANWPEAMIGITDTLYQLWDETSTGWTDEDQRAAFFDNLPLIALLLAVWAGLAIYARRWIEGFADRLQAGGSAARQRLLALLASCGQVVVPTLGMIALSSALTASHLLGEISTRIVQSLPILGFALFLARWLGGRAFPRVQAEDAVLPMPDERRAEGRVLATLLGLVIAAEILRAVAMDPQEYSDAVGALATFPILVAGGLLLWRIGRLLRTGAAAAEEQNYTLTLLRLLARGVAVIGIIGPLLAAAGYVAAGKAMVFPAILTLALVTIILVLQRVLSDLWALVAPKNLPNPGEGVEGDGLVPVLAGVLLTLISLPIFALIWGARFSDLTELWTRFRDGFQFGDTRISPTVFLLFVVIFTLGYMVTRLLQGALKNTILPRTRMERGGQTALVSGMGYVGIFLSALIAINATGLDLSNLALVASALSVGIGFGLQNIVQNFVSGIILLLERPVSEGDWIEVGGVQGIVKTISVRSTRVQTFDRTMVIVPNGDLVSQPVKNWTRFGLAGRLIVPVIVANGQNTRKVEKILREIAEAQPLVVLNPPPLVAFQSFDSAGMLFEIRAILRDVNFSLSVRTDMNHMILERFAAEGIELPHSQTEITLANAADLDFGRSRRGPEPEEPSDLPLPKATP